MMERKAIDEDELQENPAGPAPSDSSPNEEKAESFPEWVQSRGPQTTLE